MKSSDGSGKPINEQVLRSLVTAIDKALEGAPGFDQVTVRLKGEGITMERRDYSTGPWFRFFTHGETIRQSALDKSYQGQALIDRANGRSLIPPTMPHVTPAYSAEEKKGPLGRIPKATAGEGSPEKHALSPSGSDEPTAVDPVQTDSPPPPRSAPIGGLGESVFTPFRLSELPESDAVRWFAYWRNSLADETRLGLGASKLKDGDTVAWDEITCGKLREETVAKARKRWKLEDGEPLGTIAICPVRFCPNVAHGVATGEVDATPFWIPASADSEGNLWPSGMPAWVSRQNLSPSEAHSLVVGAIADQDEFMATHPVPEDGASWKEALEWAHSLFMTVAEGLPRDQEYPGYKAVTPSSENSPTCYIVRLDDALKMVLPLIGAYDHFIKSNAIPPLARKVASTPPVLDSARMTMLNEESRRILAGRHLGQLRGNFPLSPSQRESMLHYLSTGHGEVLAVNGPPGTGKTTLLHSVIANEVVQSALEGIEPRIIVASSTNNTAVINVIESFRESGPRAPLEKRWIPKVESYGCYMPSEKKAEKAVQAGHQCFKGFGLEGGFLESVGTPEYLEDAKAYFLSCYIEAMGRPAESIEKAAENLRAQLMEGAEKLESLAEDWSTFPADLRGYSEARAHHGRALLRQSNAQENVKNAVALVQDWGSKEESFPWWWGFFSFLPLVQKQKDRQASMFVTARGVDFDQPVKFETMVESLSQIVRTAKDELASVEREIEDSLTVGRAYRASALAFRRKRIERGLSKNWAKGQDQLDKSLRYHLFLLASRYWEARWLMELEEHVRSGAKWKTLRPDGRLQLFRFVAKVAPCIVVTLHRLPSEFRCGLKAGRHFLSEGIDVLILDEAGQISPQIGSISFAFAKKAVVVGDTLQIAPIRQMSESLDAKNLVRHGLPENSPVELTSSQGTLLEVAQMATPFAKFDGLRGMFLSEHRRCTDELVAFCNQLAYNGRLQPMTGIISHPPFPAWGYAHVPGRSERPGGRGMRNLIEAHTIAEWVKSNQETLLQYIDKEVPEKERTLAKAVAVITPYAHQREALISSFQSIGLPKDITIGTIHALQGAERPVVIFSPVFTRRDQGTPFFDLESQNPSMLNVAVSRAKKSFLVFGDMEMFSRRSKGGKTPSAVLAQFLFEKPENALEGYQIALPETQTQGGLTSRLQGLEDHRRALQESLDMATSRVVIVSPWLTESAVDADRVCERIVRAKERGVAVYVYADFLLNRAGDGKGNRILVPKAQGAERRLREAGAQVCWARDIHNKSLLLDESVMVEGSFNWLSATRDSESPYSRMESSIRHTGPLVQEWAEDLLQGMKSRIIEVIPPLA